MLPSPRVVNLPYKAGDKNLLDFFIDEVLQLDGLLLGLLLHRYGVRVDLHMVLDHLPRDPGHMQRMPGTHLNIIPEEGDEHEFLFVTQISHNAGGLRGIRTDLNNLHGVVLTV
jgi:hypothetical protein